MITAIFKLEENNNRIIKIAEYALKPKEALRNYIMQFIKNDMNFWDYPECVEGMRESKTAPGRWYYDITDPAHGCGVLAAYPFE